MGSLPPKPLDLGEAALPPVDSSTAPTTPEGDSTFTPSPPDMDNINAALHHFTDKDYKIRNLCCVGAGYVGGPTATVTALFCPQMQVNVVDLNEERIRRWNSRHPPIYEPGLNDMLRIARDGGAERLIANEPGRWDSTSSAASNCHGPGGHGDAPEPFLRIPARRPNLRFTTNVAKCLQEADVVLIAVNTPTKEHGTGAGMATDMAAFEAVAGTVAKHARAGAILVEKSTVPCGTVNLLKDVLAAHRPGEHFEILSNPEFLAAGTAIKDLIYPERILIGCELTPSGQRAAAALASVYANWIPRSRIVTTNVFSSELAKLVANSMLAQRISSINSIAALCDDLGADVDEVASAIGTDTRIGSKFLKAGIGFGGSCFKKDLLSLCYLAETLHQPEVAQYWRAVLAMNEYARDRFVRRVVKALNNTLSGKKVVLLGYAFKKDTNDTRESPALEIIRSLVTEAPAEIAIYDPCCLAAHTRAEIRRLVGPGVLHGEGGRVVVHEDPYTACRDADAVLVTTEFDEFKYARPRPTMNGAPAKFSSRKAAPADPRPFRSTGPAKPEDERALSSSSYCPSELELLALHSHGIKSGAAADPLGRFRPMPACDEAACPDCQLERAATENGDGGDYGAGQEHVPKERMDWARVAGLMRPPRWVFDGRGVLDVRGMDALGFRIEGTGRQRKGL